MFKEKPLEKEIDYDNDFKIVIGSKESAESHQLKSLESFSRSSESLALTVTSIGKKKKFLKEPKKKTRSASRGKKDEKEKSMDHGVSRDSGESFMSGIMASVKKESWRIVGYSEEERLRLLNMRLEGKLSITNEASEENLRERTSLKCEMEKVRKEVEVERELLENLQLEHQEWRNEKEKILSKSSELEKKVSVFQYDVEVKENQLKDLMTQLTFHKEMTETHEEKMKTLQADVLMKENVISDLKKKMCELYTQLELVKLYRENSDYQAEHVRIELEMANNARKWTEEQLRAIEEVRNKLQNEVYRVKRNLDDICNERDSFEHKAQSLELKITKLQDARLNETTQLLFELELLQKEIIISSNEKDCLEERYQTLTNLYEDKKSELDKEQFQNVQLQKEYNELSLEFNDVKRKLEEFLTNFTLLESEGNELRKNVAVLEEKFNQKCGEIVNLEKENEMLQMSVQQWRVTGEEKDSRISGLVEDLTITKNSLDRVCAEREQATIFIGQLHEECLKVSEQFELSRQNLYNKEEALKLMEDINDEIKEQLHNEKMIFQDRERLIEELRLETDQLKESRTLLQTNHLQVCNELDNLRHSFAEANMTIAAMECELNSLTNFNKQLCEERGRTEIAMNKIKVDLSEAQYQIEQLTIIQKSYFDLLEQHQSTELQLNELSERHESLSKDFHNVTEELQSKLQERELELQKMVSLKEEVVQTTRKDLQTMEKTQSQLKDSLENVKFNHAIELATKEELFRVQLEKSEKEFSQMCQEKIRCESAIESLQGHINNLVDDYNNRLKECKTKMLNLEEKSTAYEEYENKSRVLLLELERKKGEIEGILEEWKKMKHHAGILESALSKRESTIVELIKKHSDSTEKQNAIIKDLKRELYEEKDKLKVEREIKTNLKCQMENNAALMNDVNRKLNSYQINYTDLQLELKKSKENTEWLLEENRLLKESREELTKELAKKCGENHEIMKTNQILLGQLDAGKSSEESKRKSLNKLELEIEQKSHRIKENNTKRDKLMERHNLEKKEMKFIIKDVQQEKESLTRTAELSQQRELIAASVLIRLRSEVKKIIFEQEISDKNQDLNTKLPKKQLEELETLLKETEAPVMTTKPLSRLSKCIEDLRTQVDCIQEEVMKQSSGETVVEDNK